MNQILILVLNFVITNIFKKIIHGSNYYLMIYGDCSASKVQTGAACGNEVALWNQNVVRGSEHRLLTARRIWRKCACVSTRVSILALTAGCLPKLWMLEPVKLLQWLRNTDPNSRPVCHHIQGKCDNHETSYQVVQNITNGPS